MGIVTRPVKAVGGSGGTSWIAGTDLYADELNADIDTLYTEFNGLITNANISSAAAIEGSKLASAPAGIPAGKYNALSIVNADIANLTIQKGKLSTTVGQKISEAQLEVTYQEVAFTKNIPLEAVSATAISATRYTDTGIYKVYVVYTSTAGIGTSSVTPTTPLTVGTDELIGLYIADSAWNNGTKDLTGKVVIVSIKKT